MGNQNSQPSNDFQKQFQHMQEQLKNQYRKQTVDLHKLQQQIYYTQMKMNEMKNSQQQQPQQQSHMYQYQNQYQSQNPHQNTHQYQPQQPSNSLNNLLSNPELKREMANNPAFGVQIIELILKEFGTQLSEQQYEKINNYLERANQQTSQQQQQQQYQPKLQIQQPQYQQKQHPHQQPQHQQQMIYHPTQNMNMKDRYETEEEEATRKFEEEQRRQRREFEEQQKKRKAEYQKQMKAFEESQINPYKLLELPQNYTMEQLKIAYRKKALVSHPDKGGNAKLFDDVTKAYFSLLEKLKKKEDDKQYTDLKNGSRDYLEKQKQENKQNVSLKKDSFNLNMFNKIFEENKISDPTDNGYEEWLKSDSDVKEPPKVFSTKFNIDTFNSTFEDWKEQDENLGREIVLSDGPQALAAYHGKTGYTELGLDSVSDYTNADPSSRGIGYTDLKQAYSRNGIINTRAVNVRESYRNIEEYERARASKISYTMTPEEIRREEMKKQQAEAEEQKRVQRVQARDNQAFNSYNRVHQMMIDKLK